MLQEFERARSLKLVLHHVAYVEKAGVRADVVVRGDLAHIAVSERHEVAAKGHHLAAVLDVKVVQAGLRERVGEGRRRRGHSLTLCVSIALRARMQLSRADRAIVEKAPTASLVRCSPSESRFIITRSTPATSIQDSGPSSC